jgi:hypothetical protein
MSIWVTIKEGGLGKALIEENIGMIASQRLFFKKHWDKLLFQG